MYTEAEMQEACYLYLAGCGKYIEVEREVPFFSRSIDLVCRTTGDELTSVELKLHDWKHAVRQAKDHSLGADKAYICLPKRDTVPDNIRSVLAEEGIGLMMFDSDAGGQVYEVIPPPEGRFPAIPVFKKQMIKAMKWCAEHPV